MSKIKSRIDFLENKSYSIKLYINSNYKSITNTECTNLLNERTLLKSELKQLRKQLMLNKERKTKLNKLSTQDEYK